MANVDRSSGDPIVPPITGLVVLPQNNGFELSWNTDPALDVEEYLITRNDGKTFRTPSTGLQDTYELVRQSFYQWSVSVHAGRKTSIPVTTDKFQF